MTLRRSTCQRTATRRRSARSTRRGQPSKSHRRHRWRSTCTTGRARRWRRRWCRKLTDRHNISLTWGFVRNVWFSDKYEADRNAVLEHRSAAFAVDGGGDGIGAVEVHRAQPEDSGGVDDDSNLHPASAATIAIVHFAVTVHHSFGISSAVACEELLRPFFV
ncbi:hypothetical protein GUJ93_ZPchr0755g29163 [Zizania palustris]|uniref:Uncharacterized protein n=1 Tax=Zizania palustris TaxID=103762 RepID=A0A8J5W058_ZIZPA|nr:hypothetical protein GUJ93_ZPchr0755g29163 [Zizania palustris]